MRCFPVIFGLISFLPVADQGQYHLTGSEGTIKAQVGSNVVLPCSVEPTVDMRDAVVDWMFNSSKTVHLFRNEADDQESQDERFKGRTILNHKMLEHGNVSLKLADVTKNDAGIYTCFVRHLPVLSEERNIILVVVDGNAERHSGGGKGDNNNGPDPGVNVPGWVVPVVVGSFIIIIIIIITFCVVCRRRVKQISQRRSNNSPNEVRNDGEKEMEELQKETVTKETKLKLNLYRTRKNQTKVCESSILI